ncbi:adhesive plaque matrix protein-like, partial [Gryllus bimaculatus]
PPPKPLPAKAARQASDRRAVDRRVTDGESSSSEMRRGGALAVLPLLLLVMGVRGAMAEDDEEPPPAPRLEDEPEPPTRPYYPGPGVWAKPAADSGIDVGFVPLRLYAQLVLRERALVCEGVLVALASACWCSVAVCVRYEGCCVLRCASVLTRVCGVSVGWCALMLQKRHTEAVRLLPRSAAYADAKTAEEVAAAPRLRQVLSSKKIQEVYSEEGYSDSGYDHGDYGRTAHQEEDYERKEREKKPHVHHRSRPRARARGHYDDAHAAGSSTVTRVASPLPRSRHRMSHRQEITYAVTEVHDALPLASAPQPARVAIPALDAFRRTAPRLQRRSDDGGHDEEPEAAPSEVAEEEEEDDDESAESEEFESRKSDAPPPSAPPPTEAASPGEAEPTAEATHADARPSGPPVWSEEFLKSLPLQLPGVAGEDGGGGASGEEEEEVGFLPVRAMAKPALSASGPTEQEKLWRRIQATYAIPLVDGRPVQPARALKTSGRSVALGALPPQLVQPTPAPAQPRGAIAPPDQRQPPTADETPAPDNKLKAHSAEQQRLPPPPLKPKEAQQWGIVPFSEPATTASTRIDDRTADPRQSKLKGYSPLQQELSRVNKDNVDTYYNTKGNEGWKPLPYYDPKSASGGSKVEDKAPSADRTLPYSASGKEPQILNTEVAATSNFEVSPEQLKESKESGILPYFDSKVTSSPQADETVSEVQSENKPQNADDEEPWRPIPSETPTRDDYVNKDRANEERLEEEGNENVETEERAPREQDSEEHEEEQNERREKAEGSEEEKVQRAEDEEERDLWGFVPYFESKITFPSFREQLLGDKKEEGTKSRMQKIKFKSWGVIPSYSGPEIEIPEIPKPVESRKIFPPPKENIRQRPPEAPTSSSEIQLPQPTAYEAPPNQPPVHRDMTTFVPIKVVSSTGFIETKMVPKEEVRQEDIMTEKPQVPYQEQSRELYKEQPRLPYGEQPRVSHEEQPRVSTAGQSRASYDGQPRASYEEQPQAPYKEQPQISYGEKSGASYGEQPQASYKEQPQISYGDKSAASYEGQPQVSYKEQPQVSYGEKSPTSYEEQPRVAYGEQPQASYKEQPQVSYGDKSPTSYEEQPQASYKEQPQVSYGDKSPTSYGEQPQASYKEQPQASYGDKSPTSYEEQPQTLYKEQPKDSYEEQPVDVVPYFESNFTSAADKERSAEEDKETLRRLLILPPPLPEVQTKFQTPTPLVFGILPKTNNLPQIGTIAPLHFGIFPKSTPAPAAYESTKISPNRILPMSSRTVNQTVNATDEQPAASDIKPAVTPLPLSLYPGEIFRSSPRVQAAGQAKAEASETVSATVTIPPITNSTEIIVETIEDMDIPQPPPPRKDGWAPTYPVLAHIPTEYMSQYLPLVATGASSMASLLSVLQAQSSLASAENRRSDADDEDFTSSGSILSNDTIPMVIWVPLNTTLGTSLLKLQGLPPTPTLASQKPASAPPEPYYIPSSSPSSAVLTAPSTSSPSTPPTEALHSAASGDSVRSLWGGPTFWEDAPQLTPEATDTLEKLNTEYKAILNDKTGTNASSPSTDGGSDSPAESNTTSAVNLTTTSSTESSTSSTTSATTTPSAVVQLASVATTTLALTSGGQTTDNSTAEEEATTTASPEATTSGKRYHVELSRDNRPQQEQQAAEAETTEV